MHGYLVLALLLLGFIRDLIWLMWRTCDVWWKICFLEVCYVDSPFRFYWAMCEFWGYQSLEGLATRVFMMCKNVCVLHFHLWTIPTCCILSSIKSLLNLKHHSIVITLLLKVQHSLPLKFKLEGKINRLEHMLRFYLGAWVLQPCVHPCCFANAWQEASIPQISTSQIETHQKLDHPLMRFIKFNLDCQSKKNSNFNLFNFLSSRFLCSPIFYVPIPHKYTGRLASAGLRISLLNYQVTK